MIGKLKGIVEEIGETHILLDVRGVCYLVFVSAKTLRTLPPIGEGLSLFIETQMREDAIKLFGFPGRGEQQWFRLLQNVQGVGAKLALAILGSLNAAELAQAIMLGDVPLICRAPGVGKKMAERLITELKSKAAAAGLGSAAPAAEGAALPPAAGNSAASDAVAALSRLGYKNEEAARAVAAAWAQADARDTAELIRLSLQILAKK